MASCVVQHFKIKTVAKNLQKYKDTRNSKQKKIQHSNTAHVIKAENAYYKESQL